MSEQRNNGWVNFWIAATVVVAAVLSWAACTFGQDRSGVITGGAIPNQQTKRDELAVYREKIEERERQWAREKAENSRPKVIEQPKVEPVRPRKVEIPLPVAVATQEPFSTPVPALVSADVTINGPALTYVRVPTVLTVSGFTDTELRSASLFCEPRTGCSLRRLKDPTTGEDILLFSAVKAGSYTIIVGQNLQHAEWEQYSEQLVASASKANMQSDHLAELKALTTKLATAYPVKSGRFSVAVEDFSPAPTPIPPPPPQPVPQPTPPVPPSPQPALITAVTTVIIRITDNLNADHNEVLARLRQWSDTPGNPPIYEFTPEGIGVDGKQNPMVAGYVKRIPPGTELPYVFIASANSGGGGTILWHGKLPPSADILIAEITRHATGRQPLIPRGNTK